MALVDITVGVSSSLLSVTYNLLDTDAKNAWTHCGSLLSPTINALHILSSAVFLSSWQPETLSSDMTSATPTVTEGPFPSVESVINTFPLDFFSESHICARIGAGLSRKF